MFAQGLRWTAIYSLSAADTIFVERLYLMLILLIVHRSMFSQTTSASPSSNTPLRS
jgi:hypothetical protein